MLCEKLGTSSKRSLLNDRPQVEGSCLVGNAIANFAIPLQTRWAFVLRRAFFGIGCALSHCSQGLTHPPSVASEASNYPPRANSRATGRGNSSDVLLHRSGSTGVPRGSVDHRKYQPMDEPEEETHPPMDPQYRSDAMSQLDRVTCKLRETSNMREAGVSICLAT